MGTDTSPLIIAITGASGAMYGITLIEKACSKDIPVHLLITSTARDVILRETGKSDTEWLKDLTSTGTIFTERCDNLGASISSGSYPTAGMVIAPCSMGTLGRIASGISSNLIERAADVCLKERRRLILLARETPLSSIHLENMLTVTRAGGIVMPPLPAFYTGPSTIQDLINQTADRVLDLLGHPGSETYRWTGGDCG